MLSLHHPVLVRILLNLFSPNPPYSVSDHPWHPVRFPMPHHPLGEVWLSQLRILLGWFKQRRPYAWCFLLVIFHPLTTLLLFGYRFPLAHSVCIRSWVQSLSGAVRPHFVVTVPLTAVSPSMQPSILCFNRHHECLFSLPPLPPGNLLPTKLVISFTYKVIPFKKVRKQLRKSSKMWGKCTHLKNTNLCKINSKTVLKVYCD